MVFGKAKRRQDETLTQLQLAFYKMVMVGEAYAGADGHPQQAHKDLLAIAMAFASAVSNVEHSGKVTTSDVIMIRWYYETLKRFVYVRITQDTGDNIWPVFDGRTIGDDFAKCDHDFNAACDVLARHALHVSDKPTDLTDSGLAYGDGGEA